MAASEKPNIAKARDRMDKSVTALKDEFHTLRTGRASAGLLDQVMVEAYGATVPINQVAAVSVPEPRSLTVSVWDRGVVVVTVVHEPLQFDPEGSRRAGLETRTDNVTLRLGLSHRGRGAGGLHGRSGGRHRCSSDRIYSVDRRVGPVSRPGGSARCPRTALRPSSPAPGRTASLRHCNFRTHVRR